MKNLIIALLFLISSTNLYSQSWLKTTSGFEVSPVTTGFNGQEGNQPYSLRRVENRKRFGNSSLRVELRESDPLIQNGTRSELYLFTSASNPDTTLRKAAFSILFPSDSFPVDSREWIFMQFHTGTGSPNLALVAKNGRLYADIRNANNSYAPPYGKQDLGAITYNQWLDFIVEYYPRTTNDGYVKIWINDNPILNFVGSNYPNPAPNVRYLNGVPAPFWKIGGYKWEWNPTTPFTPSYGVVYIDTVIVARMSATYQQMDVTPSAANQPPQITTTSPVITLNNSTQATLQSDATDPEGNTITYAWTQESGPNTAVIQSPSLKNTLVTNLTLGTYSFKITATDNLGASSFAFVTVSVNTPPLIDASINKNEIIQNGTITLTVAYSDPDGNTNNTTVLWEQVNGPACTITSPNSATTTVTGLAASSEYYTFRVTVTDEDGGISTEIVEVATVSAATKKSRKKAVPL